MEFNLKVLMKVRGKEAHGSAYFSVNLNFTKQKVVLKKNKRLITSAFLCKSKKKSEKKMIGWYFCS